MCFFFFFIGRNEKLELTGRKSRDVGILSTSKLYALHDRIFAFTPQVIFSLLFLSCIILATSIDRMLYDLFCKYWLFLTYYFKFYLKQGLSHKQMLLLWS